MSGQGRSETIGLASDPQGWTLKQQVLDCLAKGWLSIPVSDFGTFSSPECDNKEEVHCLDLAQAVSWGEIQRGLFVGATAHGMAMFANKFPGVRAVVVKSPFAAELARRHYDANVLCLGECTSAVDQILSVWLKTPFEGCPGNRLSHHARRVAKIAALEESQSQREDELSHQKTASEEYQPVARTVPSYPN